MVTSLFVPVKHAMDICPAATSDCRVGLNIYEITQLY